MKRIIEAIKKNKVFLVTAHVNLEGDSLGSQLAMKSLLESMGKKACIVDDDKVPEHYKFLPMASEVSSNLKKCHDFDAAIVLDCPNLKRIGKVKDLIGKDKPIINIDHHVSNEKFGTINWVDPRASSAAEMVYRLFKVTGTPLKKETALCLYIAILTDTGSFNYDNTSSLTHEIAGELLGYGLNPARVSQDVYERRTLAEIKLLSLALATVRTNRSKEIAYMEITRQMLRKTGCDAERSEGFINFARSIDKAKVAVIFKENPKDKRRIDVSFRSKGDVDVNFIASHFGGGGHTKASGCSIKGTLKAAEKKVLAKVEETLKRKV